MNVLLERRKHNQSVRLDYIRRDLILGEELKRPVGQDGLGGVTSNPTIFEKAIDGAGQYDEALRDVLRPVYEASGGADGFVSIEPLPQLTGQGGLGSIVLCEPGGYSGGQGA